MTNSLNHVRFSSAYRSPVAQGKGKVPHFAGVQEEPNSPKSEPATSQHEELHSAQQPGKSRGKKVAMLLGMPVAALVLQSVLTNAFSPLSDGDKQARYEESVFQDAECAEYRERNPDFKCGNPAIDIFSTMANYPWVAKMLGYISPEDRPASQPQKSTKDAMSGKH
ncbi:MAG TPA: hypothetical protein V6C52_04250 [Coleofasciculaceae cyanobacterium]|jgi:hypothetical protein